jgi:arylsulfatase A-like enzyme
MNRIHLSLCAVLALASTVFAQPTTRPNIVVILTDDVGWGDYQVYNPQGKIASPNVDRLAREGMRFTHAHTPAALCAPTRYSMLTGNYPWRGRAPGGTWGFHVPAQFLPGQKTVANLLQEAGYRTAMFGKSGIGGLHADRGGAPDFTRPMIDGPKRWGFDYSFIIPRGHQATPLLFLENELPSCGAGRLVRTNHAKGRPTADFADPDWDPSNIGERLLKAAENFLDDVQAKNRLSGRRAPFYLHFCTDGAHSPYVPATSIRGTPLQGTTKMSGHTDMVHQTDILLGHLMAALEQRGLLADTLICFTSDNGGIPTEQHLGHDAVGGLRGMKSYIPEGGHRVPFIVRWPGKIAAGTVRHQLVCTHDIVPTALELAGIEVPAGQCLDAVSLAPVLLGLRDDTRPVRQHLLVQASPGRDAFNDGGIKGGPLSPSTPPRSGKEMFARDEVTEAKPGKGKRNRNAPSSDGMAHALYEGDWKLVLDIADQPAALYDLAADLTEQHNLLPVPAHAQRVTEMTQLYRQVRNSTRSVPLPSGP